MFFKNWPGPQRARRGLICTSSRNNFFQDRDPPQHSQLSFHETHSPSSASLTLMTSVGKILSTTQEAKTSRHGIGCRFSSSGISEIASSHYTVWSSKTSLAENNHTHSAAHNWIEVAPLDLKCRWFSHWKKNVIQV